MKTRSIRALVKHIASVLQSQIVMDSITPIDKVVRNNCINCIIDNCIEYDDPIESVMKIVLLHLAKDGYALSPSKDYDNTKIWEIDYR